VVRQDNIYVYIGGDSESVTPTGTSTGSDYILMEVSAETGVPRWGFDSVGQPVVARYNGLAGGDDHLADLVLIPGAGEAATVLDGYEVAATGASPGVGTSTDITTVLFTDNPLVMDALRYGPPLNGKEGGTSLVVREQSFAGTADTLYVTGYSSGQAVGTGYDFVTLAYGPSLQCLHLCPIWVAAYNNTGSNGPDVARDIVFDYDFATGTERVIVTGESWSATMGYEFATIAYDALSGTAVWSGLDNVRRFNANDATGDDLPSDLAVDSDGNLYVAGSSVRGETPDLSVMSYDKLGDPHWLPDALNRRFVTSNGTGSGKDFGAAIGLYNEVSNPRFGIFGTVYSLDGYGIVRYLQNNP